MIVQDQVRGSISINVGHTELITLGSLVKHNDAISLALLQGYLGDLGTRTYKLQTPINLSQLSM